MIARIHILHNSYRMMSNMILTLSSAFRTTKFPKDVVKILKKNDLYSHNFVKSIDKKYDRHLIFRDENFSLHVITWGPFSSTPFHFHPSNGCSFILLQGRLIETRLGSIIIDKPGSGGFIHNSLGGHIISNGSDHSVSLHCYSPPDVRESDKIFGYSINGNQ